MGRVRTLLVAVNEVFLDGVVAWMAEDSRIEVVGTARSGSQALEKVESLRAELVLVDATLPDMSGFEVIRRIKSRSNAPLVVMLSFHDSQACRLEAWAAGADDFVPTSDTADRLSPLVGDLLGRRNVGIRDKGAVISRAAPPTDATK